MKYERNFKHRGSPSKCVFLKRGERIDLVSTLEVALNIAGMGGNNSTVRKHINNGGIYIPKKVCGVAIWREEFGKDYFQKNTIL